MAVGLSDGIVVGIAEGIEVAPSELEPPPHATKLRLSTIRPR
jgi:hypothetical protein